MNERETKPAARPIDFEAGPIEAACERFESAWKSGTPPELERFLVGWEEPERSKLLSELLLLEFQYAGRDGRTLLPQLYTNRFPDHVDVIEEVFDRWSVSRAGETQGAPEDTLVMRSQFAKLQLHAEGGLGQVFRAGDRDLGRKVAVKFIRSTLADDTDCRSRFRLEAEITGCLEHPGVVPVYGVGDADGGRPFYAMRFIEGETLDDAIRHFHDAHGQRKMPRAEREFEFRELLGRFVAVCKTIAYAHNRCIVHRDIKPENVMLGRYGETIVIDWGLAIPVNREGVFKQSREKTLMPGSGSGTSGAAAGVAGTPAYMSPEQASGTADLTPATDIYSLGVTLYKVLVEQVPFTGKLDQVLADVKAGTFQPPTKVDGRVPKALEAICLKAMANRPLDRYATALDLAEDVEHYLGDAPVTAYPEPVSTKLARWGRRHRLLSQTILIALLIFTVAGVLTATVLGRLRSNAVALQQSEHELRKHSLSVSARFAARTIANKVDVRLRILEKEAADSELLRRLEMINVDPSDADALRFLQDWIDDLGRRYAHLESRTWFICSADGTQVARYPSVLENGERSNTLGKNFGYRDYFHGEGEDEEEGSVKTPLTEPKLSVAMESKSLDLDLIVALSAPVIRKADVSAGGTSIGVLAMTVKLGKFADLRMPLPKGQKVLLVDTRQYYMTRAKRESERHDAEDKVRETFKQTGEGLVLHPLDPGGLKRPQRLSTLDSETIDRLRRAKQQSAVDGDAGVLDNLLDSSYRDPLAAEGDRSWLAAFAPVVLSTRPPNAKSHDTGCFVIVQQRGQP